MRVVAGRFRGRSLTAPPGEETRPILDRVKVALFDWIGSQLALPGSLPPIRVLDLFCGGGSLGVESVSRGATHCTFVDRSRAAIDALRTNLESLGLLSLATVVCSDAGSVRLLPRDSASFDLVFLDPPYRLSEDLGPGSVMDRVLRRLGREIPISDAAMLLWRHPSKTTLPDGLAGGWASSERRAWGTMAVTMLTRTTQVLP